MTDRFARKPRTQGIPVVNKETGRTVYVLPETLKAKPDLFKKIPPEKAGDPRWRGKPKPPRKPAKPDKPEIPREPPPSPLRPRMRKKPVDEAKPVKDVKPVKKVKVPVPSPPRRWKKLKRLQPKTAAERVLVRYLEAVEGKRLRGEIFRLAKRIFGPPGGKRWGERSSYDDTHRLVFGDDNGNQPGRGQGRYTTIDRLLEKSDDMPRDLPKFLRELRTFLKTGDYEVDGLSAVSIAWKGKSGEDEEWSIPIS